MKFLVDVGVGKKVENWLKGNGFDVLSVRDIDSRAKDSQILRWGDVVVYQARVAATEVRSNNAYDEHSNASLFS